MLLSTASPTVPGADVELEITMDHDDGRVEHAAELSARQAELLELGADYDPATGVLSSPVTSETLPLLGRPIGGVRLAGVVRTLQPGCDLSPSQLCEMLARWRRTDIEPRREHRSDVVRFSQALELFAAIEAQRPDLEITVFGKLQRIKGPISRVQTEQLAAEHGFSWEQVTEVAHQKVNHAANRMLAEAEQRVQVTHIDLARAARPSATPPAIECRRQGRSRESRGQRPRRARGSRRNQATARAGPGDYSSEGEPGPPPGGSGPVLFLVDSRWGKIDAAMARLLRGRP